jgi:hypothetical protein
MYARRNSAKKDLFGAEFGAEVEKIFSIKKIH